MIRSRALLLALPGLWACGPFVASPPEGPPPWVTRGSDPRHPDAMYVTGVGQGDDRDAAADRARAEIAKRFEVRVRQDTTLRRGVASTEAPGVEAWVSDSDMRQITRTSTDQALEDVQISEVWTDAETARVHALATLHRATASQRIGARLDRDDQAMRAHLSDADAEPDPLRHLAHLLDARAALARWRASFRPLEIVDPADAATRRPALDEVTLDRLVRQVTGQVRVAIEVGPADAPSAGAVRQALSQAVSRGGMQRVDSPDLARVHVRVTLAEQATNRTSRSFAFWDVSARIDVLDRERGSSIGAATFAEREGANDLEDARLRASLRVSDALVAHFFEDLKASLRN